MKKWLREFLLGMVMFILAIVSLVYSYTLETTWGTVFLARPDLYLGLWMVVLAFLAFLLMVRAWKQRKTPEGQEQCLPLWTSLPVITVAAMFVYLVALDKIGFVLDSIAVFGLLTFLYSMNRGEEGKGWRDKKTVAKELITSGVFAVVCSIVVYSVFTGVLSTRLPVFSLF